MRKYFLITTAILLLAAACNKQPAQVQPAQNKPVQSSEQQKKPADETANWKTFNLPGWDIVSFDYPTTWALSIVDKNNIKLSKSKEKINIFYKADDRLTKTGGTDADCKNIMNAYMNSLGTILSDKDNSVEGTCGQKHQFEISANGKRESHNVFYVGTLFVDVYTQTPDSIYNQVVKSFKYRGF